MWKKVLLSVVLIILIVWGIEIFYVSKNEEEEEITDNIVENETEVSENITNNFTNELADNSITEQEEIQETTQPITDENRHYILRTKDGFINVYYINESDEEILYKVTEISIKYLGEEDAQSLEVGIDVYGVQELNKLLEDFE